MLVRENDETTLFLVCYGMVSHQMTSSRSNVERRRQRHGVSCGQLAKGIYESASDVVGNGIVSKGAVSAMVKLASEIDESASDAG